MTIDRHYTQPEVAKAIIQRLLDYGDLNPGSNILDPCVGRGAFPRAIRELSQDDHGPFAIRTVDIDPGVEADVHSDFLQLCDLEPPNGGKWDLVVSNPPFSLAQTFVERSIEMLSSNGKIAFILLLQFLGSSKRSCFFRRYPPVTIDVLRPRPSFAEDGSTDMREYALFRWHPHCISRVPRVDWIDWEKPRKSLKQAANAAE